MLMTIMSEICQHQFRFDSLSLVLAHSVPTNVAQVPLSMARLSKQTRPLMRAMLNWMETPRAMRQMTV